MPQGYIAVYRYGVAVVMMEYEPIEYTIAFDGNNADDGEMEAISATYDEEYTLTANAYTRDGYKFTGWNTEADGSGTSYEDGATVSNLTSIDGDTITLYAQWEEYTITVTEYTGDTIESEYDYENGTSLLYVVDGDTLEQLSVEDINGTTIVLKEYIEEYEIEGYEISANLFSYIRFIWEGEEDSDYSTSYSGRTLSEEEFLERNWGLHSDANDYNCYYRLINADTLTTYKSWNAEGGSEYTECWTVSALVTEYSPITYILYFDSNGGSGEMDSIGATYDEEYTLTANAFTRAGYKFTGWNTEADGSGTSYEDGATVSNLTTTDGDTVTLYAQWEPVTYTIAFDGNDEDDGEMEAISATYDEEYTLTANAFTRDGYTFTGWNTEADGSGTSYEDGATVSNLTTEDGATVTLYAQWEEDVDEATLISIPVTKLSLEDTSTVLGGVEFSLFELICEDDTHDHASDDDLIDVNDYDTSCWKLIETYTSDELGEFTLEDLDITKEYRLVETKTVEGYLVPEGQWRLYFDYGFSIELSVYINSDGTGYNLLPGAEFTLQSTQDESNSISLNARTNHNRRADGWNLHPILY